MITKVTIQYDGSNYHGWQDQKGNHNTKTIEEVVKKAVSAINKEKTDIVASGRTDKGVHALNQVFHFNNVHNIPLTRLKNALNNALPKDIIVKRCEAVNEDFHARFSAVSKEYRYYLTINEFDMFKRNYLTYWKEALDLEKMQEAAELFVGTHDFSAFNATPKEVKENQVITIHKCDISFKENTYIFKIEGTSFLRHMVRMMVGTLVYVGSNCLTLERVKELLEDSKGEKTPYNIEPQGLYLYKVNYKEDTMNNYHTHTYRCDHAVGTEEDYVLAAIKAGYSSLGFSEHSPMPKEDLEASRRLPYDQIEDYVNEVLRLKEKYKDQINIYLSFEFDHFNHNAEWNKELMDKYNVDYKMFGNHFNKKPGKGNYYGRDYEGEDIINEYFESAKIPIESGLYQVMAHPDLFLNQYEWDKRAEDMSRKLCKLALANDIILEYNVSGIKNNLSYPHPKFWEIVKEVGNHVIIGVDAHNPDDLLMDHQKEAEKYLEEIGINFIKQLV